MLIIPFLSISPLIIIVSRTVKAFLASPLENSAITFKSSSEILILSSPYPRESLKARFKSFIMSSVVNSFNTNTRQRESKALLISKEGFSVVAPIKIIAPFSTNGKKASC